MPSYNCACEDTLPGRKTLSELRVSLMRRLGFSAQVLNPPPGMNELLTEFLQDAQEQLYVRYASLRTERIFSWPMVVGERYYGFGNSEQVAYSVTIAASGSKYGFDTVGSLGSMTPTPIVVGDVTVEALYTDTGVTTLRLAAGDVLDTDYWQSLTLVNDTVTVTLDLTAPTSGAGTNTLTFATTVWDATETGDTKTVTFLGPCNTHKMSPIKVSWVGITDLNGVWYPLAEGIRPELYTDTNDGYPARYEIRSCIEVFPAPSAAYTLRVKGHFGLDVFASDDDKTTIDSRPVFLLALGMAKAHYGKPDAQSHFTQAMAYIGGVVGGSHHTARYVPGAAQGVDPTRPTMTEFDE